MIEGLIDKVDLVCKIEQDMECTVDGEENMQSVKKMMERIYRDVMQARVVEAVEVVHCYECEYFIPHSDSRMGGGASHGRCRILRQSRDSGLVVHAGKDYCSRGKKKGWY